MPDIINTIQTEILGDERIRQLTADIEKQEEAFLDLARSMKEAGASEAAIRSATAGIAGNIGQLRKEMDGTTGTTRHTGHAMREFGRIVQDTTQGGLGGGINNIEGLVQMLGGGAGLAGVLTIAASAFLAFRPMIEKFLASFQNTEDITKFTGHLETLTKRVKELKEMENRTAADELELKNVTKAAEEYKKGEKTAKDFLEKPTDKAAARGKAAMDFLESDRGKEVVKAAIMMRVRQPSADMVEKQAAMDKIDDDIARMRKERDFDEYGNDVTENRVSAMLGRKAKIGEALKQATLDHQDLAAATVGKLMDEAKAGDLDPLAKELGGGKKGSFGEQMKTYADFMGTADERARIEEEFKLAEDLSKAKATADEKAAKAEATKETKGEKKEETEAEKERKAKRKLESDFLKWNEGEDKKDKAAKSKAIRMNAQLYNRETKELERMAKEQIRKPQLFGDTGSYLASIQGAGASKSEDLLAEAVAVLRQQLQEQQDGNKVSA